MFLANYLNRCTLKLIIRNPDIHFNKIKVCYVSSFVFVWRWYYSLLFSEIVFSYCGIKVREFLNIGCDVPEYGTSVSVRANYV